jgi:hypothetical protein
MPDVHQHLDQAERNETLLNESDFSRVEHRQWATVYAFCVAVHLVEAFLAYHGHHSRNHGDRNREMAQHGRQDVTFSRQVIRPYTELKDFSREARYGCIDFSLQELQQDVLPALNQVRAEIEIRLRKLGVTI